MAALVRSREVNFDAELPQSRRHEAKPAGKVVGLLGKLLSAHYLVRHCAGFGITVIVSCGEHVQQLGRRTLEADFGDGTDVWNQHVRFERDRNRVLPTELRRLWAVL